MYKKSDKADRATERQHKRKKADTTGHNRQGDKAVHVQTDMVTHTYTTDRAKEDRPKKCKGDKTTKRRIEDMDFQILPGTKFQHEGVWANYLSSMIVSINRQNIEYTVGTYRRHHCAGEGGRGREVGRVYRGKGVVDIPGSDKATDRRGNKPTK